MGRPPCCDKMNVKRGVWTAEEDAKMLAYVSKNGTGNWTSVPKKAACSPGLRRCGKSCKLRFTNYQRPDLKQESFAPQEEELIVRLHAAIGSRWSIIAQQLPGRTDNDVKNYWNTKLRKKLSDMGIDPVTHKPISQILADYGNISGLSNPRNWIGSLNRDFKNALLNKAEQYSTPPQHLVPSTKMEPIQDTFLNNNSMDLLDQLQAIKLVAEASYCGKSSPHCFNEEAVYLSSSPSSSTSSTGEQEKSPLSFNWQDFLLEDVFLQADDPQEEENQKVGSFLNNVTLPLGLDSGNPSNGFSGLFATDSSFVEAMLERDNEMFMEFADHLNDDQ